LKLILTSLKGTKTQTHVTRQKETYRDYYKKSQ